MLTLKHIPRHLRCCHSFHSYHCILNICHCAELSVYHYVELQAMCCHFVIGHQLIEFLSWQIDVLAVYFVYLSIDTTNNDSERHFRVQARVQCILDLWIPIQFGSTLSDILLGLDSVAVSVFVVILDEFDKYWESIQISIWWWDEMYFSIIGRLI